MILDECRNLLKEFGKAYLEHCIRASNVVAHELAQLGNYNPPCLWLNTAPSAIVRFLVDDATMI